MFMSITPSGMLSAIECGQRFDVAILDVLMPNTNGIQAAEEIRRRDKEMQLVSALLSGGELHGRGGRKVALVCLLLLAVQLLSYVSLGLDATKKLYPHHCPFHWR